MGAVTAGVMLAGAAVGAVGTIASTAIATSAAGKAEKRARRDKEGLMIQLEGLEESRQDVINPYEGITDLSGMIQDLGDSFSDTSAELSNPFANLSVATQASEFQAEEQDISLANTLDTLMSSGASAGGATALAQAALQGKRGISANIQQQESANSKMRAQGEVGLMQAKQAEAIRLQNADYGEGLRMQENLRGEAERMQNADVLGKEFVFDATERRETAEMNRVQSSITQTAYQEAAAGQAKTSALTSGIRGVANIGIGALNAGAFGGAGAPGNVSPGGN